MGKCDVCGKETETFVACSTCGAVSFVYCDECLNKGLEPYEALVGMGIFFDDMSDEYREYILMPSLKVHGKTLEEFNADVKQLDADYYDWLQHQHDSVEYESITEPFGDF